jgi:hypothetical protein
MKASEPDESVSIIHIPELTDDLHPERFLRFDKFPVEEIDQHIPLSRMKCVLPELTQSGSKYVVAARSKFPFKCRGLSRCEFAFDEIVQMRGDRRLIESLDDFVQETGDDETLGD